MHTPLIAAEALLALTRSPNPPFVFDCSFDLTDAGAGQAQYEAQRVRGAWRADLNRDLSAPDLPASHGRHPLPSREGFAAWLGSTGLGPQDPMVVYDRQGVNFCGRLWWMLKWVGHDAVAVLDGGFPAWVAAGGAVESGAEPARLGNAPPYPLREPLVNAIDTRALAERVGTADLTVVDARAAVRFRGEVEPLDPVAGHIPGALNRPFTDNLLPDGRFKSPEQLRAEFTTLLAGRDTAGVVHQCGSGVSAVPNLIAMEIAGFGRSVLYPGSWSAWCNTSGTPRARG